MASFGISRAIGRAMCKILGNGKFWGTKNKVTGEMREQIIRLLQVSELPISIIAKRLGLSVAAISTVNAAENYIRPKGFRPDRI